MNFENFNFVIELSQCLLQNGKISCKIRKEKVYWTSARKGNKMCDAIRGNLSAPFWGGNSMGNWHRNSRAKPTDRWTIIWQGVVWAAIYSDCCGIFPSTWPISTRATESPILIAIHQATPFPYAGVYSARWVAHGRDQISPYSSGSKIGKHVSCAITLMKIWIFHICTKLFIGNRTLSPRSPINLESSSFNWVAQSGK